MGRLSHAATAWLAALIAGAAYGADEARPAAPLPRIVVAFSNQSHVAPGPAGASGSRYDGGGYRLSQSAQHQARRIAADYGLRPVASWPIEALTVHCVVFEITDGRPVAEVLTLLSKDTRVVLVQPLQEFHTLNDSPAPDLRPGVRRAPRPRLPAPRPHSSQR
jgi:hypothetical protein